MAKPVTPKTLQSVGWRIPKRLNDRIKSLAKRIRERPSNVARFALEKGISIAEKELK